MFRWGAGRIIFPALLFVWSGRALALLLVGVDVAGDLVDRVGERPERRHGGFANGADLAVAAGVEAAAGGRVDR